MDKFVGQPSDSTFTGDRLQKNRRNTFDFRLNGVVAGRIGGIEKPNLGAVTAVWFAVGPSKLNGTQRLSVKRSLDRPKNRTRPFQERVFESCLDGFSA